MVSDHPWDGGDCGWPSMVPHLVLILLVNSRAKFHVCSTLPYGIFWMVGDHPWDCGWPSGALHLVLILWLQVCCRLLSGWFWWGLLFLLGTGGKESLTDFDCTIRLGWSLTKIFGRILNPECIVSLKKRFKLKSPDSVKGRVQKLN